MKEEKASTECATKASWAQQALRLFQDKSIEGHAVTKAFRDFLRRRSLEDEETALRFLVLTQALINCDRQVGLLSKLTEFY